MGLFSKKTESHTVEEAINNHDEKFAYTCQSGNTYSRFPSKSYDLSQWLCAVSFDDAFEMYAPRFVGAINQINKNVELLTQQNQLLQMKCDTLAKELEIMKKDNTHIR